MTASRLDNVADVYVMTPMQKGMLFHSISEPRSGVFVNQIVVDIRQPFDANAYERAWERLTERHEALRTAFLWDGLDDPLQVVRETVDLDWLVLDWTSRAEGTIHKDLDDLLRDDRRKAFDLSKAPLIRHTLVRLAEQSWKIICTVQHMIADGWSMQVLLDEAAALYEADTTGEKVVLAPTFRFRDFVAWQRSSDPDAAPAFWSERLAGYREPFRLEIPGLPPPPGVTGHAQHSIEFDRETTDRIRDLAATNRVTVNSLVLSAWLIVLSRWSRTRDVVIGVTTSGRPADLIGVEHAVGLFINTIPLRMTVDSAMSFFQLASSVQSEWIDIHQHETTSLADIQRWADISPGDPLFEHIFVFENYPTQGRPGPVSLDLSSRHHIEQSNYPLALLAVPGEKFELILVYDTARISVDAADSLGTQIRQILRDVSTQPEGLVSGYTTVGPEELARLDEMGTGPELENDMRAVIELFHERSAEQPDRPAVVARDETLTYRELGERVDSLAASILARGAPTDGTIAIHCGRSVDMIVGILAALRAGSAYLPLDPTYPSQHLELLIDEIRPSLVLSDRGGTGLPPNVDVLRIQGIEDTDESVFPSYHADSLAYVIPTSGSTGMPKGVMVTNRNLVASTLARRHHYPGPPGVFMLLSPFAFDSSIVGIFWTLLGGGTLVLPDPGLERDLEAILELAERERVTHLLTLPSLYELMVSHEGATGALASLEVAIVAGEPCAPRLIETHVAHLPRTRLYNEYGPTEATVWATVARLDDQGPARPVPIGRPIAGAKIEIVDHEGHPVPPGFLGEILIGGSGVAQGYIGDEEATSHSFVRRDGERFYRTGDVGSFRRDGQIMFLGRIDTQVKIRGHRMELEAVEAAVAALPNVSEAVVTAAPAGGRDGVRLVAYVSSNDTSHYLREVLARAVPAYMLPDLFVMLDGLPRLPNGKVNRSALPAPDTAGNDRARVAPRNDMERTLARIWSELLGIDEVGATDDFFALGGDSIVAIQMVSRARQAGIRIDPAHITRHPTIAGLAAVAPELDVGAGWLGHSAGPCPLGPIQRWFLSLGLTAPDHWNMARVLELSPDTDVEAMEAAWQDCLRHHDLLRARFDEIGGEWVQTIDEHPSEASWLAVTSEDRSFEEMANEAQKSLDLSVGPVSRAVYFRAANEAKLIIVMHHLVVDVISWAILLDDLATAYDRRKGGEEPALPARTAPFGAWAESVVGDDHTSEVEFWVRQMAPSGQNRHQAGAEADRLETSHPFSLGLPPGQLETANAAFNTKTEELMVTSLVRAIADFRPTDQVVKLLVETHGRDAVPELDVSRTIGWFTRMYPLALQVGHDEVGDDIRSVKETMRRVPNGGTGYGVLRWVERHPELTRLAEPDILFNFLGRTDTRSNRFQVSSVLPNSSRAGENAMPHPIEIVAAIRDGQMQMSVHHTPQTMDVSDATTLLRAVESQMSLILDYCSNSGRRGFTPSDFPEAGMGQDELDEFLEELT